jgi:nucleotide-binding universal stress UspA family protein
MMKSILVAMDGSPASLAGLQAAVGWAEVLDAELRGIFVEDEQRFLYYPAGFSAEGGVPVSAPLPEDEMREEEARATEQGDEVQQQFEATLRGHTVRGELIRMRGNVNQILTREARAVDLVVMGLRGRNDAADSPEPGPTTETLIHNALRPVMVVPARAQSNGTFVFAYDGGSGVQRVVAAGTELAAAAGARTAVISIGDESRFQRDYEEVLRRYWQPYGLESTFHATHKSGRIAETIVRYAREQNAGMIVMGAFGHNPLHELFFGSTTLETLAEAPCPVLLMA